MKPRSPRAAVEFLPDGTVRVPLTKGKFALIDAADWPHIGQFNWIAQDPYGNGQAWYATRRGQRSERAAHIKMHSFLTGWNYVDHVDGDGLNNCRSNLRHASSRQNAANRSHRRTSVQPFKGVSVLPSGRWRAVANGRHLGVFLTAEIAARAYDAAALVEFGEFARLNFPEER